MGTPQNSFVYYALITRYSLPVTYFMILSPHILAGTAIVLSAPHPLIGIPFAVGAHYFLDSLPHTEYQAMESLRALHRKDIRGTLPFFLKLLADGGGGILLAVSWAYLSGHSPLWAFAGGVAGVLPDGMTALKTVFLPESSLLAKHDAFHVAIHADKIKWPSPVVRIGLQILVVTMALVTISF